MGALISRTKTSKFVLVSPVTRLLAAEENPT
jgi:hypothetical protein